jgi:hypothetical protein
MPPGAQALGPHDGGVAGRLQAVRLGVPVGARRVIPNRDGAVAARRWMMIIREGIEIGL